MQHPTETRPAPAAMPRTQATQTESHPRINSEELLRGHSTLEIEHAGQRYILRLTRENKLILTK